MNYTRNSLIICALFAVFYFLSPLTAEAYIGPGAGMSLIGSFFMFLFGILVAIFMVLLWPIRLLIKKMKKKSAAPMAVKEEESKETIVTR